MTELFPNISEKVREEAQMAWNLALHMEDPVKIVNFLNDYTQFAPTDEIQDFLRFFFNAKMEEMNI